MEEVRGSIPLSSTLNVVERCLVFPNMQVRGFFHRLLVPPVPYYYHEFPSKKGTTKGTEHDKDTPEIER